MSRNLNDQQFHDAHKFDVSKVDWSGVDWSDTGGTPAEEAHEAKMLKRQAKSAPKKAAAPKTYPKLRSVK